MGISTEGLKRAHAIPLFAGIPENALGALLSEAEIKTFSKNSVLVQAGEPANRFYIVLNGSVELFVQTGGKRESVIEIIGAGDLFDVAAIFDEGDFSTGARVIEGADLIVVPRRPFLNELDKNFDLIKSMMASLSRQLRGLVHQVGELKLKTTGQRLGTFLLGLTDAASGQTTVRLPYDKRLLAGRLGMQPESLSRAFSTLRGIGVRGEQDLVIIENLAELRSYCEDSGADH
ncbi:MAG: cyclic nucleotide-binding domain-containing protein [Hyphomicrobiales bacterium]|nr:cyclic nucleotide-binding domain-containing protein [Hyphomicrobiales bacterium]